MEDQKQPQEEQRISEELTFQDKHSPLGRVLGGIVIIGVGGVLLAHRLGVDFPAWLFTWPMIPIVIGFYVGAKHLFRGFGWLIPMVIGGAFLATQWVPGMNLKPYIVPVVLILIGLGMILSRERRWKRHRFRNRYGRDREIVHGPGIHPAWSRGKASTSTDDLLDLTIVVGGIKKQFISKDFKGGEVTCVFGGAEIDLSQCDINGTVELELTHVFGGSKLTVPANWHLRSEITTVMGGVEDNRNLRHATTDHNKTLVLKGTCFMGGITIMSY